MVRDSRLTERHRDVLLLNVWPLFDVLRPDPRFDALLERLGLQ